MRILTFSGTPKAIGEAFGESCRAQIAELYALRIKNAVAEAADYSDRTITEEMLLELGQASLEVLRTYHPAGIEELHGIARGADRTLAEIWVMNALTDLRDLVSFGEQEMGGRAEAGKRAEMGGPDRDPEEGCTCFLAQRDLTDPLSPLCGQTWDLIPDNQPYVLVVRREPEDAPHTISLTLTGCLSMIGMNDRGIAIGTTNVRSNDGQRGVSYLDLIHRALAATDLDEAAGCIESAQRAGAHFYFLLDERDRALAIECTARRSKRWSVDTGAHVSGNQLLVPAHQAVEVSPCASSSPDRCARLQALIDGADKPLSPAQTMRFLSDHEGAPGSLCRHFSDAIRTNGAMVMAPADRRAWAVFGPPCSGTWVDLSI